MAMPVVRSDDFAPEEREGFYDRQQGAAFESGGAEFGGIVEPEMTDGSAGTMPGESGRSFAPLSDEEIKSVVQREIEDALGGLGSQLSEDRRKALRYYYGRDFGNEVEGRSKVILTDVADTIEWIMPSLMRMFTGGQITGKYIPRGPEQIAQAEQATEYINMVFRDEQRGFMVLHDWFKDALLEKTGITKAYSEERFEPKIETYRGLTENGVMLLLQDGRLEPIAFEQRPLPLQKGVDPETGQPDVEPLYDVSFRQTIPVNEIKVDLVPPEEFLSARRMIELNDRSPFTAHRKKMTVSDLIALGHPREIVENLPSDDTPEYSQGRTERLSEDETFPVTTAERSDPASRELWTTECYIRIDEDGDGYAELRKITVVGEQSITILDDNEINWQPFSSLTPIPMPHKFHGLSVADQVSDLQLIRSTLLRQMLDNMYLVNNGRYEVVEGAVEIDDLLTSRPGGVVRVTAPGMVNPLPTTPFNQASYQLMDFLENVRQMRTGAGMHNQGLDASTFRNQTATGVSQVMNAAYARVEMIARIFAETGVKDLFKKLLKLMVESPVKDRVIRLRGEWVEVDPSTWNTNMGVEIQVGLGVGQAGERIGYLAQLLEVQAKAKMVGLTNVVSPDNFYRTGVKMVEAMQIPNPEMYLTDPKGKPPDPPQPDGKDQVKMAETKRRSEDNRKQLALDAQKVQVDMVEKKAMAEFRVLEMEKKLELERDRLASQERIALAQIKSNESLAKTREKKEGGTSESND
jgi:hypothetical protein